MNGRQLLYFTLFAIILFMVSCREGHNETEVPDIDTLVVDTVLQDTLTDFEEKVEELVLPTNRTECFSDFIFTFVNNRRFQAERIKFPLPLEEIDGSIHHITSGKDFRSDFVWPSREEYTMLLTDPQQMETYQNNMELSSVEVQIISLRSQSVRGYYFQREEGRWYLMRRRQYAPQGTLARFLSFYQRFTTDSVYRQQSVAEHMNYATTDPDGEMERVEGTLERSQWPAFSPDMPQGIITNINFGQPIENTSRMVLLQCGTSSGMMDIYTFLCEEGKWKLISYEN